MRGAQWVSSPLAARALEMTLCSRNFPAYGLPVATAYCVGFLRSDARRTTSIPNIHPMKLTVFTLPLIAALAASAFPTAARADDKKKMLEWQLQQQQLQQQWKIQEVQRQQQILRQQQANQRSRAIIVAGTPWGVSQNGRGTMGFTGAAPDRLNSVVVTLNNFYNAAGNVNNSGSATLTLYGGYSYPLRGTWSMQGNFTVGLSLTPAANAAPGDRATGNLTMTPPSGTRISRITLTGVMSGSPFTANFSGQ